MGQNIRVFVVESGSDSLNNLAQILRQAGYDVTAMQRGMKALRRLKARRLFCYWAVRELGASLTELARRLNMSVPAVGYSVERGEMIADKNDLRLTE